MQPPTSLKNPFAFPHPYAEEPHPTFPPLSPTSRPTAAPPAWRKDAVYGSVATVMTLGPSQCIGVIGAIIALAKMIFFAFKALHFKILAAQTRSEIARQQALANAADTSPQAKAATLQEIATLSAKLQNCHFEWRTSLKECHENGRHLMASLLSTLPLVGVVTAGFFLAQTSPHELPGTTPLQKACQAYTQYALAPFKSLTNIPIFPLGQLKSHHARFEAEQQDAMSYRSSQASLKQSTELMLPVNRGDGLEHAIRCRHFKAPNQTDQNKTVVLFHGNYATGDARPNLAQFYLEQGWNVMTVTTGGYPESDAAVATSEMTAIQDVNAVMKRLKQQGVASIAVHGDSIGGVSAMHATQLSDSVVCAIASKTFDNVRHVAGNVHTNGPAWLKIVPKHLMKAVVATAAPVGIKVPGVKGKDGRSYKTDGMANDKKAAAFAGVLVAIGGKYDQLMGLDYDPQTGHYRNNFSERLYQAHYQANGTKDRSFHVLSNVNHSFPLEPVEMNAILAGLAKANELIAARQQAKLVA